VRRGDIASLINHLDKEARPRPTRKDAGPDLRRGVKGQRLREQAVGIVGVDIGDRHLANAGSVGGAHLHLHLTLVAKETIHQMNRRRGLVGAVVVEELDGQPIIDAQLVAGGLVLTNLGHNRRGVAIAAQLGDQRRIPGIGVATGSPGRLHRLYSGRIHLCAVFVIGRSNQRLEIAFRVEGGAEENNTPAAVTSRYGFRDEEERLDRLTGGLIRVPVATQGIVVTGGGVRFGESSGVAKGVV